MNQKPPEIPLIEYKKLSTKIRCRIELSEYNALHGNVEIFQDDNPQKPLFMTPREIAEKYVYGKHDALTDSQEIEDMIKDIEACKKEEGGTKINEKYFGYPNPPLDRVILEGVGYIKECPTCHSSMPRSGFLRLFGKRYCLNDKCPNSQPKRRIYGRALPPPIKPVHLQVPTPRHPLPAPPPLRHINSPPSIPRSPLEYRGAGSPHGFVLVAIVLAVIMFVVYALGT